MKFKTITCFLILCIIICFAIVKENRIDPFHNSYVVDPVLLKKSAIERDLNYFLDQHKRNWSPQTKRHFINVIYTGSKTFKINYKVVMSIISVESKYDLKAIGKNKNSFDYGLTQQNSKYLKVRYKAASKYLNSCGIQYNLKNKYDLGLNVFACFNYLKNIEDYGDLNHFHEKITAYNRGINGAKNNNNYQYYYLVLNELTRIKI